MALASTSIFFRPSFHVHSQIIFKTRLETELVADVGKVLSKPKSLIVIHATGIRFQNRLFVLEYSKLNRDQRWMFCCYDEGFHLNFGFALEVDTDTEVYADKVLYSCFQKLLLANGLL